MSLYSRRELLIAGAAVTAACRPWQRALGSDTPGVKKQTVAYAQRSGKDLLLDLYLPQSRRHCPAIVFLHGGGWSVGSRETGPDFTRFFARDGFAMVSIDYRLTPDGQFPANLEDVKTAIRWLRTHAKEYRVDPERIGLWGTSAGGYLAAMAALTPAGEFEGTDNRNRKSAVRCVLDAYGPVLFTSMDAETAAEHATLQSLATGLRDANAPAPPPARPHAAADSAESKLMGAPIDAVADNVKKASPLTYVSRQAPPFLIMHGLADDAVPHHQSVQLYEALAKADAEVTLRLVDGLPHSFFNRSNLDELAGPFHMTVQQHSRHGGTRSFDETARAFDVAREFFTRHLV
jgi:acetyl esterase/lipase